MSDSLAGQKFRVMALSAQAAQAVDVERACREQVGARTASALTRGKLWVVGSVAGLALLVVLRHRRKDRDDRDQDAQATQKRTLLAKAGMAVLVLQRVGGLVTPFMRGMHWAAQRDRAGPTAARYPESASPGE